jgi:hypothetical protein
VEKGEEESKNGIKYVWNELKLYMGIYMVEGQKLNYLAIFSDVLEL